MSPLTDCLSFSSPVYADGSICLDILQNRWSPTYDVSSILTSIQVGHSAPQHNSHWTDLLTLCWIWCAFVTVLCCCSRYWTSRTPTARPTVRPHSSTRRTSGSMRRGLLPLWSRVGWTSERLRPPTVPSSPPLPPPPHSCPSRSHFYLIETTTAKNNKKRKTEMEQLYQKNSSATLKKGRMKQPNHSGHIKQTCLPIRLRKTGEGDSILCLCFLFFNAWCEISYC